MSRRLQLLIIAFILCSRSGSQVGVQHIPIDKFFENLSPNSPNDEVERDQGSAIYQRLLTAPHTEIEPLLPMLLQHTSRAAALPVRGYATLFLSGIAMRDDGASMLAPYAGEVSSLLVDQNPEIQKVALAVTDYVIARDGTNNVPYTAALEMAIKQAQTPQAVGVAMVLPLLRSSSREPGATLAVTCFMRKGNLTPASRVELLRSLGDAEDLPLEVSQALVDNLDPSPTVRAAAVSSFADSHTAFHALAKSRVERAASDTREDQQVRELAKQAIAGRTHLDPNSLVPNVDRTHMKPQIIP